MATLADLSIDGLLSLCTESNDGNAWQEFVRRFQRQIAKVVYRVAARYGRTDSELIDDLVQETYLKLCADNFRILRGFAPQCSDSFTAYISVLAANVARDYFRFQLTRKRSGLAISLEGDVSEIKAREFDAGAPASIERSVLLKQIESYLSVSETGPDHQRNVLIFWLYYRVGLTASAIACLPEIGLGEKGVESTILRLTRAVRNRIGISAPNLSRNADAEGIHPAGSF